MEWVWSRPEIRDFLRTERVRSAYGVNTEHSTDGVETEHIWSGYGADQRYVTFYGRSGYGVHTE